MMKSFTVAILIAGVPAFGPSKAFGDADDERRIGQYFCVVEYAVGINTGKDRTYAGQVELPENDKKFFVRIKRIERSQIERELCARSANSFMKAFNEGADLEYDISSLYGTSSFVPVCLAMYVAEIPLGDASKPDKVWSYVGLNAYYFKGFDEYGKFSLFGNGKFMLTFRYDSGPTLQEGRCERIQQK
jgi:plasmid maintenance system killer protein